MGLRLLVYVYSYSAGIDFRRHNPTSKVDPRTVTVKAACLESRKSRIRAPLWHSSFKETK